MEFQWILGAGLILMLVGIATVFFKREITTGQALVFAFGGALVAVPQIANFELSDGTLKFTTRSEAVELATQVKALNAEQNNLAKTILELTNQNEALAEQIAQIDRNMASTNDSATERTPEFVMPDWSIVKQSTQNSIEQSDNRSQQLDILQQQLQVK